MGGDHAPEAVVEGAVRAARTGVPIILVGERARIEPYIPDGLPISLLDASEQVETTEQPVTAVRRKPNASINVAVRAVSEGRAGAVVSCGHTGGVMASALFGLGRIAGVSRPAVTTVVPRIDGGHLVLLDMGANVDCRPQQLMQFAVMGNCFARQLMGRGRPRVGLLSNGQEDTKGNELVRQASALIAELPLDYRGPIEPMDAFRGACDVLVCDGFVGNVMLKTVEATAEVVVWLLKQEIERHPSTRLGAWLMTSALKRFRNRTDYSTVGGALLLGVKGVVVVGHGRSDAPAVTSAIHLAQHCATEGLSDRIKQSIAIALANGGSAVDGKDQ